MVKACLWDWVGTLRKPTQELDNAVKKAIYETFSQRLGVSYERGREVLQELSGIQTYTQTFIEYGLKREDLWDALRYVNTPRFIRRNDRILEMFSEISDYSHAIITTMPRDVLKAEMDAVGFEGNAFKCTVCGDDVTRTKPDKEPFLLATRLLDVEANDCAMIGDRRKVDLNTAKELGMETILIGRDGDVETVYDIPKYLRRFE